MAIGIAIAAPYLAPIALGALGITASATAIAVATAVISTTLAVGASFAMRSLGVGVPSAAKQIGPPTVFRQTITNSFIVYGKRRVGGLLVFFHSKMIGEKHWRYFVIAVAGHRCKGVVSWMLNDEIVNVDADGKVLNGPHQGNAWLTFDRGVTPGVPDPVFVSQCNGKWTSAHRGDGIAKIYARFELSNNDVEAGMPNITAIIEGKDDILDPRDGLQKYTRNAALIFYDWLKTPREEGGFGAYSDEIADDAWISAQANVCDESVNGQPRYALDAVLTTGAAPAEVRDALIVNCAGSYTYTGGKHLMRPGYWVPVSETLNEDDLAAPIQVSPFMASDAAANEVQGTYISPEENYQGAAFPTQSISVAPADIRQIDLDLAFTTNPDQAARVARIMLNRAQAEKSVVWPMNISGLKVKALDTVQLNKTDYGLNNYAWTVVNWGLSADWGVVLNLREEDESIYVPPSAVVPVAPPTVTAPTSPTTTPAQLQSILRDTYPKGMSVTATDAGSNVTVVLHGAGGTGTTFALDYPGSAADVTVGPGSIPGLAYTTTYYLYADVDAAGDATPTFGATTTYATALNSTANPNRIFLNRSITTPAAAGAPTSGTGSGGGYGGPFIGGGGGGYATP